MSKKIGRNEKCPCGSGKKYKNCCLKNGLKKDLIDENFPKFMEDIKRRVREKEAFDAIPLFKNYNSVDLLSIFALLQVLPENHGKNIRLEELVRQALLSFNQGENKADVQILTKYIHENLSHNYLEDPPENLFTRNLMTPAGNFIIFPGIIDGQDYYLQQLILAVNHNTSKFPEQFIKETLGATFLILALGDIIARSFKYKRNMSAISSEDNNIFFPSEDFIEQHKYHFLFTDSEMEKIAKSLHTEISVLDNFLIDLKDSKLKTPDSDLSPILYKPILKINGGYVLISPSVIVFSATNIIISKAIQFDCLPKLISDYSAISWSHSEFLLDDIGFQKMKIELPETELPIFEGVYKFDSDKLAYIIFEYDTGEKYDPKAPLTLYENENIYTEIQKRKEEIGKQIVNDPRSLNHKFFNINISLGIGRPRFSSFEPPDIIWKTIAFLYQDLIILYGSDKCNNLTLWNYSIAVEANPIHTPFFLDNISFFIANDESFYSTDKKVDWLQVAVGNSINIRTEAINNLDEHLVVFPGKNFEQIPVTREKLPALLDIYSTRRDPVPFKVCTNALGRELWIIPIIEFHEPKSQKEKLDSEICVTIAYWLSEMSHKIKQSVKLDKIKPIVIKIQSVEIGNAFEVFDKIDKNENLLESILYSIDENEITIRLNELFFYNLYRTDNYAEKILMSKILDAINNTLLTKGLYSNLTEEIQKKLIDEFIPISKKKKLLMQILDNDIRVHPENVKGIRNIQSFQLNRQLDGLGTKLSPPPYEVRVFPDEEKTKVINSGVDLFYTELRKCLEEYDFIDILKKLLMLHESAIQRRESFKFEITPKILCFEKYCNILEKVSKEDRSNVALSLSLRCLIEHIVAEPTSGTKIIDVESLDASLAYMHNIINWGFVSDELKHKIGNPEITFLESGRVGIGKEFSNETIDPFYKDKFSEDISRSEEYFKDKFTKLDKKNVDFSEKEEADIDKPFMEEYEVDIDEFFLIAGCSVHLAFEREGSVYHDLKSKYIQDILSRIKIDVKVVEKFISLFSIFNRGKVQNVSQLGFKNEDFYPWRYNRALSLLNKPLIISKESSYEYIWFGSRSVYDFAEYILNSIYSGRLKAKSNSMKSYIAKINRIKGGEFNSFVFDFIKNSNQFSYVDQSVEISPSGKLKNSTNIGDIDILVVDKVNMKIFALECKNTNTSRTPYEMYIELMNFMGKGNDGWISKVDKRLEWLKENTLDIGRISNIDVTNFELEYIFITKNVIPISFLKEQKISYRFIPFYKLREDINTLVK